jgi:prevent-host-death family protein
MIYLQFTELRKNARKVFDNVENGEIFLITRRGKPIAEIIPFDKNFKNNRWKRKIKKIKLKGETIAASVISERELS